jgi:hypothetical protein
MWSGFIWLWKKRTRMWRWQWTSGFYAVRTSKLAEKISVPPEGFCFVQLVTNSDATENRGSSYLRNVSHHIQGYQKVSVHLMITIHKVTQLSQHTSFLPHCLAQSHCLAADCQSQGDTRLTLTLSVIPKYNYVIMVSDWNCLKYFCVFLYCNHQLHRDFLITLYKTTRCQNPEDYNLSNSPRGNRTPCMTCPTANVRLTSCKAAMRRPDLHDCAGLRSRTPPKTRRTTSLCTHSRFVLNWNYFVSPKLGTHFHAERGKFKTNQGWRQVTVKLQNTETNSQVTVLWRVCSWRQERAR